MLCYVVWHQILSFAGVFSIYWALAGRPELGGDLAARWAYLQDTFNSNRVSCTALRKLAGPLPHTQLLAVSSLSFSSKRAGCVWKGCLCVCQSVVIRPDCMRINLLVVLGRGVLVLCRCFGRSGWTWPCSMPSSCLSCRCGFVLPTHLAARNTGSQLPRHMYAAGSIANHNDMHLLCPSPHSVDPVSWFFAHAAAGGTSTVQVRALLWAGRLAAGRRHETERQQQQQLSAAGCSWKQAVRSTASSRSATGESAGGDMLGGLIVQCWGCLCLRLHLCDTP